MHHCAFCTTWKPYSQRKYHNLDNSSEIVNTDRDKIVLQFLQKCEDDKYDEFVLALFDSSEDETEVQIGESRNGRQPNVARNREDGLKSPKAD